MLVAGVLLMNATPSTISAASAAQRTRAGVALPASEFFLELQSSMSAEMRSVR